MLLVYLMGACLILCLACRTVLQRNRLRLAQHARQAADGRSGVKAALTSPVPSTPDEAPDLGEDSGEGYQSDPAEEVAREGRLESAVRRLRESHGIDDDRTLKKVAACLEPAERRDGGGAGGHRMRSLSRTASLFNVRSLR